jgi:hypothetical protein
MKNEHIAPFNETFDIFDKLNTLEISTTWNGKAFNETFNNCDQ